MAIRELYPEDEPAKVGDAIAFHNDAHDALDQVLIGEKLAKNAFLVGAVIERPTLYTGLPAGGKSQLMHNLWRLFDWIELEDVARIPGKHDLTDTLLVGGEILTEKSVSSKDGSERSETTKIDVKGIVQPTTKAISVEEMNRTAPEAVNALLPVMENRRLETSAGHIAIPGLVYIVAAQNPHESGQSTFPLSDAATSRLTVGAILGLPEPTRERRIAMNKAVREFKGKPEKIEPIVSEARFNAIKAYVAKTAIDHKTGNKIDEIAVNTADALYDLSIRETDRRFVLHLAAAAKALGSLRNSDRIVNEEDITDAVEMLISARLGAKRNTNGHDIKALVQKVTKF